MHETTYNTVAAKHVDTGFDDLVYEVKLHVVNRRTGKEMEEHWFECTRVDAETRKGNLCQRYANMYNDVTVKIQPHILPQP